MWTKFWTLLEVLKGAFSLFKQARKWFKEAQKNSIDDKAAARDKAADEIQNVTTREEFIEKQKEITRNLP